MNQKRAPADQAGPAPGFGSPARVIFSVIFIFLASQFAILLVTQIWAAAAGTTPDHLFNQDWYQTLMILLSEISVIGLVIYFLRGRKLSLASIGLGRRPVLKDVWRAAVGYVLFFIFLIIITNLATSVSPGLNNEQQDVGFNQLSGSLDRSLAFIALVIFPPFGEEILFRGYLFSGLRKVARFWPALLITSLLFAAPHHLEADSGLLWSGALDTFVLSVVLCFLREKTGALYAGILIHMLNNLVAFGIHFH
jgi:membrane protease YdiL (CAAX protease family)